MKASALGGSALVAADTLVAKRQNSDKEVIASYANQGLCFHYIDRGNRDKALEPCKIFCKKTKNSDSYGVSPLVT